MARLSEVEVQEIAGTRYPEPGEMFGSGHLMRIVVEVSADRFGRIGVTYRRKDGTTHYCSWACFRAWVRRARSTYEGKKP